MEFGLDKCAKIVLKKRKVVLSQNLIRNIIREVQQLEQGKTFRYLGSEESEDIHQQVMIMVEEGIHQEIRMIIKAELNAGIKLQQFNISRPIIQVQF